MKTEVRIGNVTVLFHGNRKEAQATLLAMATLMHDFAEEIRVAAGLKPVPDPIDSRAQVLRTASFPASPHPKPAPPANPVDSRQSEVGRNAAEPPPPPPSPVDGPAGVDEMKIRRDAPCAEPSPAPFLPTADCPPPTGPSLPPTPSAKPRFPREEAAVLINPYRRGGSAPVPQQPKPYEGPRYRSKAELAAASTGGANGDGHE